MTIRDLFHTFASDTCASLYVRDQDFHILQIMPDFESNTDLDHKALDIIGELQIKEWWVSMTSGIIHIETWDQLPITDSNKDELLSSPAFTDTDTTRDCILYALSEAEDQEEKDYYWYLLETADFAEDYE